MANETLIERLPSPPKVPVIADSFDGDSMTQYRAFVQRVRIADAIRAIARRDERDGGADRTVVR